MDKVCTNFI